MNKKRVTQNKTEIKAVLTALMILACIEGVLWILETNNFLDEPYHWGNRNDIPFKINQCKHLFSNPIHRDKIKVIAIGDSKSERAFDPYTFDEYFNNKTISYNFGISGCSIRFQAFLIEYIILTKLKPDFLIWVVDVPNDFKDHENQIQQDIDNLNLPMASVHRNDFTGLNFEEKFDLFLLNMLKIYQHRIYLDLKWFIDEYHRGLVIAYEQYEGDNEGLHDENSTARFHKESGDIFLDTIELIENEDLDYLIVTNPHRDTRILYPPTDYLFNQLSSKNFLDLNGNEELVNNSLYYNSNHLNYYGAQIYTNLIGKKLDF